MTTDTSAPGAVSAVSANGGRPAVGKSAGSPNMAARVRPSPRVPWGRLEPAENIDDVVRNLDQIIDWSMREESTIGYFAVLYKRSTVAVREALNEGQFDDRRLMEQFDVHFAQRYFDALNAYFHPDECYGLTLAWEVAFVGHENNQPTMLQQMIAGLNAHICFDLGVAAATVAPNSLDKLEPDFNLINALVASQVRGMLDVAAELSPALRWMRRAIPNEVGLIKRVLTKFRASAWHFAIYMALHPEIVREKRVNQVSWTAALCAWYLQPPEYWRLFPVLIRAIAKRESRDVASNLRALDGITNSPDKVDKAYL